MIIHMLNRMALKQIQAWYLECMMMWTVVAVEVEVVTMLQDRHGRKMETRCVQTQSLWYDNARPAGAGGTGAVVVEGGAVVVVILQNVPVMLVVLQGSLVQMIGPVQWEAVLEDTRNLMKKRKRRRAADEMMGKYMMNLATLRMNSVQKHNRLNLDRWFLVLNVLDGWLMR